jgi:pimeloyl-ACP methyl ester carboxylesterase
MSEHQRRYADSLPDGRHEVAESGHLIQAEQPRLLATLIQELLQAAT